MCENTKKWIAANKERAFAAQKAWREANPKRNKELIKAWVKANPEKVAAGQARRRHLERTAPGGPFLPWREDYKPRIAEYNGVCAYCLKAPFKSLDHAVPLSRGGSNYPENVFPVCGSCNSRKRAKILHVEWTPPCAQ